MTTCSIIIPISKYSVSNSNYVQLEQKPWESNVGKLTKGGVWAYLDSLLFGDPEEDLEENCGMNTDGSVNSTIYAYPFPFELPYYINSTRGTLGEKQINQLQYSEIIQVQSGTAPSTTYQTDNIISADWIFDPIDTNGNIKPQPSITWNGGKLDDISDGIYGSILIVYDVVQHVYPFTIFSDEELTENKYSSFIYAVWEGGNNVIEFVPSDDAIGDSCKNRGEVVNISDPDPSGEPTAYPEDQYIDWDYCSDCQLDENGDCY